MTTYYMSPNGDDASAGTSVGTAIKTLDALQALLGAGDTVYFEAGVYTVVESTGITFSVSGSDANNRIKWIGDVKGEIFDSKGSVLIGCGEAQTIMPFGSYNPFGVRITITGDFYHFENLTLQSGDDSSVDLMEMSGSTGHYFYRCHVVNTWRVVCISINYESFSVDAPYETIIDSCVINGLGFGLTLPYCPTLLDSKITMRNCLGIGTNTRQQTGMIYIVATGISNTYIMGKIKAYHNTSVFEAIFGGGSLYSKCTGHTFINNLGIFGPSAGMLSIINEPTGDNFKGNRHIGMGAVYGVQSDWSNYFQQALSLHVGGVHDAEYYRRFGTSPYQMWEPYHDKSGEIENYCVSAGEEGAIGCEKDIYGNLRANSPKTWLFGQFYNNDGVVVDPDGVWTSEAALFAYRLDYNTIKNPSTLTYTQGSNASNYVIGSGIATTDKMTKTGLIHDVIFLIQAANNSGSSPPTNPSIMGYEITASGGAEVLATGSIVIDISADKFTDINEIQLTVPIGGWSHTVLEGLQIKIWKADADGTAVLALGHILFRYQTSGGPTPGAVQAYNRPVADETVLDPDGNPTLRLDGAGMHQVVLPVPKYIGTTYYAKVTYYMDANYDFDGEIIINCPLLHVKGLVNESELSIPTTTDTEEWRSVFAILNSQTEDGFACVQFYSRDKGKTGKTWIGKIEITDTP